MRYLGVRGILTLESLWVEDRGGESKSHKEKQLVFLFLPVLKKLKVFIVSLKQKKHNCDDGIWNNRYISTAQNNKKVYINSSHRNAEQNILLGLSQKL